MKIFLNSQKSESYANDLTTEKLTKISNVGDLLYEKHFMACFHNWASVNIFWVRKAGIPFLNDKSFESIYKNTIQTLTIQKSITVGDWEKSVGRELFLQSADKLH